MDSLNINIFRGSIQEVDEFSYLDSVVTKYGRNETISRGHWPRKTFYQKENFLSPNTGLKVGK